MMTFTVLDDSNSATVTMNNPFTGHSQRIVTLASPRAIAQSVMMFARQQNILPQSVEVSTVWPEQRA